ncbi:streptogrisin C [Micrococcales bacterium KH10]|nr:streptogrisin C [Micrococcales bacterium KH10]
MRKTAALLSALTLAGTLAVTGTVAATSATSAPTASATTVAAKAPAASAAKPMTKAEQIRTMVRELKITKKQAKKRLKVEKKARNLEPKLQKKLGGNFAGLWVSKNGKKIVVGVTTKKAAKQVRKAGAKPKLVKTKLNKLNKGASKLNREIRNVPDKVSAWWVDPVSNKVVIQAKSKAAAKKAANVAGLSAAEVSYDISDVRVTPVRDYWGGDPLWGCTLAFAVHGGFLTAGHCAVEGRGHILRTALDGGGHIGTVVESQFGGGIDAAWATNAGSWNGLPRVTHWNGGGYVEVRGSQEAPIGAHLCKSGNTTKWTCGYVLTKNVNVNYGNNKIATLTETSACARPGDSGGAYIWNDQAQGITSGIADRPDGCRSFFQPVNPILQRWGLTLKTAGSQVASIQGWQNKCIDVPNSNFSDGVQLQLWNCNGTNAQRWQFANDGTLRIGGKCMDARWAWTHNGTEVQLMNCNGHVAQKFTLNGAGDLVNLHANKCVDVEGWGTNNGAKLQLWECHGGGNQKWWRI